MSNYRVFTSESVCAGHPDKIADQISDAVLDEIMRQDPHGRAAVETAVTANRVILFGEINTTAKLDVTAIARQEIERLGYVNPALQFTPQSHIDDYIREQSSEIAVGVDASSEGEGAGDQGMMFGFACNETPELMPLPIELAHRLTKRIDELRETGVLSYLRPDGKAQVSVEYKDGKPLAVRHVTVAVPHNRTVDLQQVRDDIYIGAIEPLLYDYGYKIDPKKDLVVNGTGVWHFSGPAADAGLTGRKIVVDGYGGYARVGGGAFSGKDCTKVDRSAAYAARYLAKNIVAAGLADKVEVQLAYYIGAKKPVMQEVDTFGTEKSSHKVIKDFMDGLLDTSVRGIIKGLDLRRPIYKQTAAYGHFGRAEFPWEQLAKSSRTR
ncbi:MAG TPA: methionine adenosyltransferase [Candidatus Saccharimonadales bacterium]|nr:methionine adenosyltransferase [Candidatus Saccharimonadales bacterium]